MDPSTAPTDPDRFSAELYDILAALQPGVSDLELLEFRYALSNVLPQGGWSQVSVPAPDELQARIADPLFFSEIQLKPTRHQCIVLDERVVWLTQVICAGLVTGQYSPEWVSGLFYFDLRAFLFFVRPRYYTEVAIEHLGGAPAARFEPGQRQLERLPEIGYKQFKAANQAVDRAFLDAMLQLVTGFGTPQLVTMVGPSAAGKTEIVERLHSEMSAAGRRVTSIEMDNFYKDREYRDQHPMGLDVIHFDLFKQSMAALLRNERTSIPRYDFLLATSSHDLGSRLRPGQTGIPVEPGDIILLEGNFPFHHPEISPWVGFKVVYLTDDPIRLKRKWKRDIDYRKKYDPAYFCNRYFRTQAQRASEIYRPMMAVCDLLVDTTAAELWMTPATRRLLSGSETSL
jgi:uridine kinase